MRANPLLRFVRALLGVGYLAGAAYHVANVTLWDPGATFESFADMAWWGWYEGLIREAVVPLATPFTVVVLVFELTVGLLILSRDRTARYGHAGAIAFNLVLIPTMSAPFWYGNVVLVALHLLCLATRFQEAPGPARRPDRSRELTPV